MIKNILIAITLLLLMILYATKVEAVMSPETFIVEATLEDIEETVTESEITVHYMRVKHLGEDFYTIIGPRCQFYDDKNNEIELKVFQSKYLRRLITITLIDIPKGSMAIACRVK